MYQHPHVGFTKTLWPQMDVPDEDSKAFNGQMVPFFSSEESDNVGFTWFYSLALWTTEHKQNSVKELKPQGVRVCWVQRGSLLLWVWNSDSTLLFWGSWCFEGGKLGKVKPGDGSIKTLELYPGVESHQLYPVSGHSFLEVVHFQRSPNGLWPEWSKW